MASVEQFRPAPSTVTSRSVSTMVDRVRRKLGLMLVLLVSAAVVAGAALAALVAGNEASAAIAAAAVMLAVTLVLAVAMLAERRSLARDAARDRATRKAPVAPVTVVPGNGTADWMDEAPTGEPPDVRPQADLLEELLHWPQRRGA